MNFNFIISLLIINTICLAQVSIDSTPKSFNVEDEIEIPTVTLPTFNVQNFLNEDEQEMRSMDTKPYRFANPINVDFNMEQGVKFVPKRECDHRVRPRVGNPVEIQREIKGNGVHQ